MRYLSLFSGIGAFEKALDRIGVDYELVGFSEIDKYAIKSYCAVHNVDEELNLGDVSKIDLDKLRELGEIDLITHGSPCQDFSIAGRLAGGDKGSGTRSSLMWCTVDIVEAVKPKYVIWENVKNLLSAKNRHNFDGYLEIMDRLGYNSYYKVLNAKNFGIPQNRERVFTISIRKDIDTGYEFPEGFELKCRLKDILEKNVEEKYYLSDKLIAGLIASTERNKEKGNGFAFETTDGSGVAKTITTRVGACRSGDNYIKCIQAAQMYGTEKEPNPQAGRIYSSEGLSPTLDACSGGNRMPKVAVAMRGRYNDDGKVEQQIEISNREIANSITTVQKDSMIGEPCLKIKEATKAGYKEAYAGDGVNISGRMKYQRGNVQKDMCQTIMANGSERGVVTSDMRIRKLSPRECWRLMGFDDEDFERAAFTKETLYIEGGLIKCNAKLKAVKEKRRHIDMDTYVLCTTSNELEQDYQEQIMKKLCISKEMIEKTQNVNIAIEPLEDVEPKECVTNIIKCGDYTETLYTLIKNLEHYHTAIIELEKTDSTSTGRYMKITSEENLDPVKSYIISILIKQIITSKIYGVTNQKVNIQGCIAITTDYEKSLMMMKLSNLKMEFTTRLNSDSALYKQAGNSIVVTVLEAIFKKLFEII